MALKMSWTWRRTENCRLPADFSRNDLVKRIRRVALSYGTSVCSFKAYTDIALENTTPRSSTLHSELQSAGVTLIDCPHNGRKDVADKMMLGEYSQRSTIAIS
jgi:hypothetical protein